MLVFQYTALVLKHTLSTLKQPKWFFDLIIGDFKSVLPHTINGLEMQMVYSLNID